MYINLGTYMYLLGIFYDSCISNPDFAQLSPYNKWNYVEQCYYMKVIIVEHTDVIELQILYAKLLIKTGTIDATQIT